MISDELTSTPLGTETAQNHFSTKAERMLLVTNATEYLYVCVLFKCICVCVAFLVSGERIERASYTRSRSGSPQKSHLLTMHCCDTHICTNVKS